LGDSVVQRGQRNCPKSAEKRSQDKLQIHDGIGCPQLQLGLLDVKQAGYILGRGRYYQSKLSINSYTHRSVISNMQTPHGRLVRAVEMVDQCDQLLMSKTKSLAVQPQESSVESFISQAIAANAPIETMERLFDLRAKVKAEMAKEAFVVALSDFQSQCPIIAKTKKVMNKDGRTVRYVYAPMDAIVEQIKKPLAANGLSYTFTVENTQELITATAKVTHKLGHSETSSFNIPVDKDGYMTIPQKVASALTFAKRYALCDALGISTGDEDTDATDVNKEPDAKSIKAKITLRLRTLGKPTETKEQVEQSVKHLTQLDLKEENYEEIAARLQAIIEESYADKEIQ
jgi:hypothetical protein